jgi:Alpha-1,3-glucanase catalytic domain D1/Alpha-1,3-glucanase catalytic domain D2
MGREIGDRAAVERRSGQRSRIHSQQIMNCVKRPDALVPLIRTVCPAILAAAAISLPWAQAFGGATVPWTTYEAEDMATTGAILGPQYGPNVVASEASGRRCVELSNTGAYVEFTAQAAANAIVVRYSVPDSADGAGADSTISLYKNGVFVGKLPVTSRYSWLYGNYPWTNTPASGSPRNFFDEVRTNGLSINPGDVVRLEKDATDAAAYYIIDLVDLENVAAPLTQPANSLSILSYGAGGAGTTDDTVPLVHCIADASSQGKSVWLPPGTYKITSAIYIPSNVAIQGAGMWYSTLAGDPSLYAHSYNRVALYGSGSHIHLSDFAIVGKLNYRNDIEPNDGLGGSFGTGSTISRIWVEHTKTGAWLVNSLGLVVDSCRVRDTIADGINLCVGMRGTTVTNCATRGTGDDCFAIWPATYTGQTYTPGLNVVTHCTGQCPFLANGGAIYGGADNRIEDCLFQDMTYGCGILISTTFPVGGNTFSGTTVAQRSDLVRCGGYDPGWSWRAALQLCLQTQSVSGITLDSLNISDSISDGLSVIAPGSNPSTGLGTLANAVMSNVNIPNYGIGAVSRNGLWASPNSIGSMTVSNCAIVEYRVDSANFTFNFVTSSIPVTASLNFIQQPGDVPQGAPIVPEVQVQALDTNNQALAGSTVTISLSSGTGTLGGALSRVTDAGGIAHFADLSVDQPGPKSLAATAGAGGVPLAISNPFMVIGPAVALAFTTQPGSAVAGIPFGRQPVLETVDQFGNPTTAGLPASLFVYVALTNGAGSLLGTSRYDIGTGGSNGVVGFGDLAIDTAGSGNQLVASTSMSPGSPVPGAVLWLDGSDASTLTTRAARVQAWKNKGTGGAGTTGTNLWFTQNAAALQPWLTNQLNGKSVVTFDKNGSGFGAGCTYLGNIGQYSYTNGGSQMTCFVVARQGENSIGWQGPVSFSTTGQIDGKGTAGVVVLTDGSQAAPYPLSIQRNHSSTPMQADVASAPVNTPFLLTFLDDAGAASLSVTEASGLSRTSTANIVNGISPYAYTITDTTIGGRLEPSPSTVDNGWDGDVAEVLVYDTALGAADRASVESYLANKWFVPNGGLSLSKAVSEPFAVGSGGTPPRQNILSVTVNTDGSATLTYAVTPGFPYHVEVTTNLSPAIWTTIAGSAANPTGGEATFTDTNSQNSSQRFYRTSSP